MRTNLKTWSSRTDKIKKKKKKSHCNRVLVYTTNQQKKIFEMSQDSAFFINFLPPHKRKVQE